jgi:ABC-type polysaccharide/polyol phosphate export permease
VCGWDSDAMTWSARHVHLIRQLTRREIAARYRGSVLGVLWSLVTPLLTLALYTFLFWRRLPHTLERQRA